MAVGIFLMGWVVLLIYLVIKAPRMLPPVYWRTIRCIQERVFSEMYSDYDPERHDEFLRHYGNKEMLREVEDAKKAGLWEKA